MTSDPPVNNRNVVQTSVAIIGGGLAGLNAARLLHREGTDFQLVEAEVQRLKQT
jgi:2-polyprenyl-6-methoxyphenol hydroxylase-like FAD-dependent oxidoreductase